MASLSYDKNRSARLQFTAPDRSRKTIRLGKMNKKAAEAFKLRVEHLIGAQRAGVAVDPQTADWLRALSDDMHGRLARTGLVEMREARRSNTLRDLLDAYFDSLEVKPGTRTTYLQTRASLEDHLGPEASLESIDTRRMDEWRASMLDAGLAPATVTKRVKTARAIFAKAVRWGITTTNPAEDVKAGSMSNPERTVFIDNETISKVIDAAPDAEWRLLISLGRFGGLRLPSEALSLRWEDILWARSRMRVRSSKTEHHEGRGERLVPLFPEIQEPLLEAFELAEPGAEYVISSRYRTGCGNLNTQLRRIIRNAGLTPWPRTLQNLRASRATELVETFPAHVCEAWLGHTQAVADRHYRMIRDEDFERAAAGGAETGALVAQ